VGLHLVAGLGIVLIVYLLIEQAGGHGGVAGCAPPGPSANPRRADGQGTIRREEDLHGPKLDRRVAAHARAVAEGGRRTANCDCQGCRTRVDAIRAKHRAAELEAVIAGISDAVVVFDQDGVPLCMNSAAYAMWSGNDRYETRESQVLCSVSLRRPDGVALTRAKHPWMRTLEGETVSGERLILTNLEGREHDVVITASPLMVAGRVSGAIAVCHDVTQCERSVVQEERRRLSRELHDHVSQSLYGIALGAHAVKARLDQDPEKATEALDYIVNLADTGLAQMRALIFDLRPEGSMTGGLTQTLSRIAQVLRTRHGLEVDAVLETEPDVSAAAKEAIYRITQEAVNNMVKHAQATRVRLSLSEDSERVTLEIQDDGIGFDPNQSHPGHLGLHTMRERAQRLGGGLRIDAAPGRGVHIAAHLPKAAPESAAEGAPRAASTPASTTLGSGPPARPRVRLCAPQRTTGPP
jgi:signal transduction histidine kinase